MRCFPLKYTKYSCGKAPFSSEKSLPHHSHRPNHRLLGYALLKAAQAKDPFTAAGGQGLPAAGFVMILRIF